MVDAHRQPLRLICAETLPQRRALCDLAVAACRDAGADPQILDLAGDLERGAAAAPLQRLDDAQWSAQLWAQAQPVLQPWLQLLELEPDDNALTVSQVPGLASVLRCLYLADQLQSHEDWVVLLPASPQALEIVRLALQGPELLEGLWQPLLQWWDLTRARLAQFELVLRLRLPQAADLQLSASWRSALAHLAQRLSGSAGLEPAAELWLAMAVDAEDSLSSLNRRLVPWPLNGLSRLRVWLQGELCASATEQLGASWQLPLLVQATRPDVASVGSWLAQAFAEPAMDWQLEGGEHRCRIVLPGLERDGLVVRQFEQQLLVRSGAHQLVVPLPPDVAMLSCRSARVESPCLLLRFC